jgi:putative drug exporter of the RND superfamily
VVIVLGLLAGAATTLTLGPANGHPDALSQGGAARTGLTALERSGMGSGALTPIEILAPRGDAAGLARALGDLPGVQGATAPQAVSWRRGTTSIIDVFTHDNRAAALASVREAAHAYGPGIGVGGIDAQNRDFTSAVYGSFPLMIALFAVLGFVLLTRAFRSRLLPAKAVALNIRPLSPIMAPARMTPGWAPRYAFSDCDSGGGDGDRAGRRAGSVRGGPRIPAGVAC